MKKYLDIGKASQLKNLKDKLIYRLLEIFPGILSWTTLILAFLLSIFFPVLIAIFIILFDLYWLLKAVYLAVHQIVTFLKLRKNLKTNWGEKLKELRIEEKIYHIICLPFFKEGKEIVESSILALKEVSYPKEKLILILAVEEKGGERARKIAEEMKQKYSKDFFKFFVTIHPKDLKNEVAGKGANVAFAIKETKKAIESLGIKKENILFSVFDIDTRPYPNYFSCLTYHYLKLKKPQNVAFQPIPIYNNNIWQAPSFSRVVATSNTFWQMVQQERPEQLVTYSSHTLCYSLFDKIEYPKEVVSDDSRIFWKAFFYFDGNFRTIPLFYPISMDAVLGKNLSSTIVNQYKQQRRWAFGAENIPFVLFNFLKNKKIPLSIKISQSFIILEGFWSWATASLLIFFMGWLPVFIGKAEFKRTVLGFNLPILTRNLMTLASFGIFICGALSLLLLPPSKKSPLKKLSLILQWILLPITLIFFGCFPALDAQTKLIFGRYLGFWPTEKIRK
jgi:hypothetical protein